MFSSISLSSMNVSCVLLEEGDAGQLLCVVLGVGDVDLLLVSSSIWSAHDWCWVVVVLVWSVSVCVCVSDLCIVILLTIFRIISVSVLVLGPWVVLVSASNISLVSGEGAQVFGVVVVGVVLRSRAVLYSIVGRAEFCLWAFVLRYWVLVFW